MAKNPVRTARRVVTPKPVKRATRAAGSVLNPINTVERVAEDAVVAGVRGGKKGGRRRARAGGSRSSQTNSAAAALTPEAAGKLILERHPVLALVLKRQSEYQAQAEATTSLGERVLALTIEIHTCNLAAAELKPTLETAKAFDEDGVFDLGVFKAWADPIVQKLDHEITVGSQEVLVAVDELDEAEGEALGQRASVAIDELDAEIAALNS